VLFLLIFVVILQLLVEHPERLALQICQKSLINLISLLKKGRRSMKTSIFKKTSKSIGLTRALTAAALTASFALPLAAAAEQQNWHPGIELRRTCQRVGPLMICAINQGIEYPRLYLQYDGYLLDKDASHELTAYVKLNGIEGFFRLTSGSDYAYYEIARPTCYLCQVVDSDLPAGEQHPKDSRYPLCAYTSRSFSQQGEKGLVYEVQPIAQEELHLFDATKDQKGYPRPWEVEVAIHDGTKWDSDYGRNYHALFGK
jgi:hypothetical protein